MDINVLNLGYGWKSRYILVVERASHIAAGEVHFKRLNGVRLQGPGVNTLICTFKLA